MIVEDEAVVGMDLQMMLTELGYSVPSVIATGEEAVALAGEINPNLVLMDINLSGSMDGIDAAGEIRNLLGIPVIYLTAFSDDSVLERAKKTEPSGYLLKPIGERALYSAVETALYKHSTERNRSSKREQWLSAVLDGAGEAVIALDLGGRVTSMNPAAEALSGADQAEAVTKPLSDVVTIAFENSGTSLDELVETAQYQLATVQLPEQTKLFENNITSIPIDGNVTPVIDDEEICVGAVLTFGVVRIFRDMAERKRLERQLLQAQKMEAVGQLTGGVAHDFNNLLTVINGYSQIAMSNVSIGDEIWDFLHEIQKAGERASHLTRRLLTFSRQQNADPLVVDVNDLIADVNKMLRRLISEEIEIVTIAAPSLKSTRVERGQVELLLMNLAVNAGDAMPGGGKLVIETSDVVIDTSSSASDRELAPGQYVMVAVSDTGLGMSEETTAHIFEPFFTTKQAGMGTGLGLSTCKDIAKQNSGHIFVESEVGVGTTFRTYFPSLDTPTPTLETEPFVDDSTHANQTVLLVEDDPMVRELLAKALSDKGYTILEASNGIEALRIAGGHTKSIDVLVTDIVMPLLGGKDLADRFQERNPDAKVVFTSGYMNDVVQNAISSDPNRAFLQKPFTPVDLSRNVRKVLIA